MIRPKQRVFFVEVNMTSSDVKLHTRSIASILAIFDIVIADIDIHNIVLDSREVNPFSLFIGNNLVGIRSKHYLSKTLNSHNPLLFESKNFKSYKFSLFYSLTKLRRFRLPSGIYGGISFAIIQLDQNIILYLQGQKIQIK